MSIQGLFLHEEMKMHAKDVNIFDEKVLIRTYFDFFCFLLKQTMLEDGYDYRL